MKRALFAILAALALGIGTLHAISAVRLLDVPTQAAQKAALDRQEEARETTWRKLDKQARAMTNYEGIAK